MGTESVVAALMLGIVATWAVLFVAAPLRRPLAVTGEVPLVMPTAAVRREWRPAGLVAVTGLLVLAALGALWYATSSRPAQSIATLGVSGSLAFVGDRLYLAGGSAAMVSRDAGSSWVPAAEPPPPPAEGVLLGGVSYRASATEGVLASRDGGRSWGTANGFVNGALPTRVVTAIAADPTTGTLLIGTDRGVFRSVDGGSSWARMGLSAPIAGLAIASGSPNVVVAIDAGGRIYRSSDRGATW